MANKFVDRPQKLLDQYPVVDDEKLRLSLISLADQWNDYTRSIIYETYNDPELMTLYRNARDTGAFQKGWKDKSHRETLRFPNPEVYMYCKAVFEPLYGPTWAANEKVWRHELVRPWMLINIK
jgi:hypothetical protein